MEKEQFIMIKGDAWTPQYFWSAILVDRDDVLTKQSYQRDGFVEKTRTSATEIARFGNARGALLGHIGDQFFSA